MVGSSRPMGKGLNGAGPAWTGGEFRLERPRRGMGTDGRLEEDTVECGALSNALPLPRALQMHAIVPTSRAPNGSARHTFATDQMHTTATPGMATLAVAQNHI